MAGGPGASLALFNSILGCQSYADVSRCLLGPVSAHIGASSSVFLQFVELAHGEVCASTKAYLGDRPKAAEHYVENGVFTRDPCLTQMLGSSVGGADLALLSRLSGWRTHPTKRSS